MRYSSLSGHPSRCGFGTATRYGLAPDRGLYFPEQIPQLPTELWTEQGLKVWELGAQLLQPLVSPDLDEASLLSILEDTLSFPLPLHSLQDNRIVLELSHGPTAAFKDVGARFMARALRAVNDEALTVLVATSGDTGSAVAHGFLGLEGVDVVILYPKGRVSPLQERQLTTAGQNVKALRVNGNFDACQDMVKSAFMDAALQQARPLTSANSINVARWLPQSIYYAWATYQLGEAALFSVPSGNLGNLAAGVLAARMGMPTRGFVAATNLNDGLPRFLAEGSMTPRSSIQTLSNAMDVGDPSNLKRLVALFAGDLEALRAVVKGVSIDDEETLTVMKRRQEQGYWMCPHTAVGDAGLEHLRDQWASSDGPEVLLATAHPAKFDAAVHQATGQEPPMPERLAQCLTLPMQFEELEPDYPALRDYLLSSRAT